MEYPASNYFAGFFFAHLANAALRACAEVRAFDFPRPALPPSEPMVARYAVMVFIFWCALVASARGLGG